MDVRDKKIFVGLSGGVDSAVATALLKEAGARVTGVFIKGWYPPRMPCTWALERRDAMRVAARLRIPFHTLDASAEYKKSVIDYLLAEYRAGRTPNPDVMCNREVKFGAFYRYAMEHSVDFIATGHYARTSESALFRGVDEARDQSYFLWAVPKEVLAKTLFPLEGLRKSEVRALAKRFNLPVAEKPDSQGICFLGSISVKDFLRQELGDNPAILYTLGERVPGGYVIGKDIERGTIKIGPIREASHMLRLRDVNRLADWSGPITAQYRYHGPPISGCMWDVGRPTCFVSDEPLPELCAPGQSLVLYRDGECLGGGIID